MTALFTGDGRVILAGRAVRNAAGGMVAVLLATYLEALGADGPTTGLAIGVALASGAGLNLVTARVADRVGRRRFLALAGLLTLGAGLVLAFTESIEGAFVACAMGGLSPAALEGGAFLSVEQAMLPEVSTAQGRTSAFAWYNVVGALAAAAGALASGTTDALSAAIGQGPLGGYHVLFLVHGLAGVAAAGLALVLSPAVEAQARRDGSRVRRQRLSPEGRRDVGRLAGLFSIDSFAGGMVVRTFTAYWFTLTFAPAVSWLAAVFFAGSLLQAVSFLVAARIAKRLGLVRTMVYTHLPSNVALIALPFAPTFEAAAAIFLLRLMLAQMDVPPRQEFVVSVVAPDERTAAAATTNMARQVSQAGGPFALGAITSVSFLGAPFAVAGSMKIVYDLLLLKAYGSAKYRGVGGGAR